MPEIINKAMGRPVMRCGIFFIMLFFAAACAAGYTARCEDNTEKTKTKEDSESARDYAFTQKAEFIAKKKSELAEINIRIDKISEKVEKSSGAAKDEAKSKLQSLRDQAAELNKQLDSANDIPESKWADFKVGFNKSYKEMKDAVKQSRQWLSKKIAP